jgi:dolichyl-phosphate beta-glucosyltransferase
MKRTLQFAFSLAFGSLVLWAVLRQFDLRRAVAAVRLAHHGALAFGIALMVLGYLLRGARWRIWERSLSYWDSLRLILIGFMGNNVMPARLGEVLRAHCASAKIVDERGRTAALASITAERVLDGLVLAVFGLVGVALVPFDGRFKHSLLVVSLVFALLAFGLALGICFHARIRFVITAANRKFPGHVTAFVQVKANHFLDGLLPLNSLPRLASALAITSIIWGIEVASCYFIGSAVWAGMNVSTALLFLVVVNFASLIPLTVGGIGTIEGIALPVLVSTGIAPYSALAMILLQHSSQYLFTTLSGGLLYLSGGFYRIPLNRPKSMVDRRAEPEPVGPVFDEVRSSLGQLSEIAELRPASCDEVDLSIIIPAYNEQSRLPRTVLEAIRWCTAQTLSFELIIADDGSRDATAELARLFEKSDVRIRALVCPHMGKGATVRMGMLNARGRFVLFMDADGATPMAEIPKLVAAIEAGNDIAIGSRVTQSPGQVEVKTQLHRKIMGRIFAFFVNVFAIEGIGDTQCGFKMFRNEAARAISSRQRMVGFAFDVEQLFLARRMSLTIAEIPVNWVAQAGSKVNLVTDSIRMLWDISQIKWMHRGSDFRNLGPALRQRDSSSVLPVFDGARD